MDYIIQIVRIILAIVFVTVGIFCGLCFSFFIGGVIGYGLIIIIIGIFTSGITVDNMIDSNYLYLLTFSFILGGLLFTYYLMRSTVRTSEDIREGNSIGLREIFKRFKADDTISKEIRDFKRIKLRKLLAEYQDYEQHKNLVLDARLGMIDMIKMKIEDPTIPLSLKKYDQDGTETDLETGKKIKR